MNAKMDIQARFGIISSRSFFSTSIKSLSSSYWTQKFLCSRRNSDQENQQNNGDNNGDKNSTDWDKAWSSFRKQGNKKKKKSFFSDFLPNKYVSWNPRRSDYPLSEEVDPIKRTERSNLMLWTSPGFTLAGAIRVCSKPELPRNNDARLMVSTGVRLLISMSQGSLLKAKHPSRSLPPKEDICAKMSAFMPSSVLQVLFTGDNKITLFCHSKEFWSLPGQCKA